MQRIVRKIVFSLVPALLLVLLLEFVSLHYYFRDFRPETLGVQAAAHDIRQVLLKRFDPESVNKHDLPPNVVIFEWLYGDEGKALLGEFQKQYQESYEQLALEIRRIGARLLVVYVPPTVFHPLAATVGETDSQFFRRLAEESGAEYLDMRPTFAGYPLDQLALLPQDLHLSRFGNQVLAAAVAARLESLADVRSDHRFDDYPALFGDLPSNTSRIWRDANLPFEVTINSQGLRMTRDVGPRGASQRILLLGDSFTFGYNVHDSATYPEFLSATVPDREVINAGVPGYTIPQETSLFIERSKYTEPDIVVLQILFNDLFGLFSFERNIFSRDLRTSGFWFAKRLPGRERMTFEPSELERRFVERLRSQ